MGTIRAGYGLVQPPIVRVLGTGLVADLAIHIADELRKSIGAQQKQPMRKPVLESSLEIVEGNVAVVQRAGIDADAVVLRKRPQGLL